MTKEPRPHAELIKQWAEGADIQYRKDAGEKWKDSPEPAWVSDYEYRVKPERNYPMWLVADEKIWDIYINGSSGNSGVLGLHRVVNSAIREMIDGGVVVPRAEFALAIGDRDKRDMAVAEAIMEACVKRLGYASMSAISLCNIDPARVIAEVTNV